MFGLVRLFLIWLLVLSLPRLYGRSHTIRTFVVLSLTTPALSERGAGPHQVPTLPWSAAPSLHTAVIAISWKLGVGRQRHQGDVMRAVPTVGTAWKRACVIHNRR